MHTIFPNNEPVPQFNSKLPNQIMKIKLRSILAALALASGLGRAVAQGTAFTYEGRLDFGIPSAPIPATGLYDFQFRVYDAATLGLPQGPLQSFVAVPVTNGLFTVRLDFGSGVFTGPARWLDLKVQTNGAGAYTQLTPRTELTPTPYAIFAGGADAAGISGIIPDARLSANIQRLDSGTVPDERLSPNIARANQVWLLNGNAGTDATTNFLGTTDNQPLELRANYARVFRFEPDPVSPKLIGGFSANYAAPGAFGSVIGGGGSALRNNRVYASFDTISGGEGNFIEAGADHSVIAGGEVNRIQADADNSTVAGGYGNIVQTDADYATIGGGFINFIQGRADHATISGGRLNTIRTNAEQATIGGGYLNSIQADARYSTISGGGENLIQTNSSAATIGGGQYNLIETNATHTTIAGGRLNIIQSGASYGTVGGGFQNTIQSNTLYASISGGSGNSINAYAESATIGGGAVNTIQEGSEFASIGGGSGNVIQANARGGTIGGGGGNHVWLNADYATVSGGFANNIQSDALSASIGGGRYNTIQSSGEGSTVSGGMSNVIQSISRFSTIGGGAGNSIFDIVSTATIGGGRINTIESHASEATIGGGTNNRVQTYAVSATIGGGMQNTIETQASQSVISGGQLNKIQSGARGATIAGGANNLIHTNAYFASIPGGWHARATHQGQLAHASGRFATDGDAQTSTHILRRQTTDATTTDLLLDGFTSTELLTIPAAAAWTFEVQIVGRTQGGQTAGYNLRGVIENVVGVTALVGTVDVAMTKEDVAAWNATAVADNINDALAIRVTGVAATTIRWVATVRTTEVIFP